MDDFAKPLNTRVPVLAPDMEPRSKAGPYSIGSDKWPGLSKLAEEAGETLQVVGKLIATGGETAHWDGSDLRARLIEELGDLMAACGFVAEANGIADAVLVRMERKAEQFRAWHDEQRCLEAAGAALSQGVREP